MINYPIRLLRLSIVLLMLMLVNGACNEFILEPRITFEISLSKQRLRDEQIVELTLHSFNLEISSLKVELLRVGTKEIDNFILTKEERFNQILIEFPLPDSIAADEKVLVGMGQLFYATGYAIQEIPEF